MFHFRFRLPRQAALALGCVSALGAAAQTPAAVPAASAATTADRPAMANAPSPLDAQASVPALRYQPAFAGYTGVLDQPLGNWKAANDLTARIGGWRAYAKQAREPDAAPMPGLADRKAAVTAPAAPAAAAASMPAGHGHHKSP